MNDDQVREIVRQTIDELTKRQMIRADPKYSYILHILDPRLRRFFKSSAHDGPLYRALSDLSDDPYIDIIYLHYRDGRTIAQIAEAMDKDDSTIKRNKKRLVRRIYHSLNF